MRVGSAMQAPANALCVGTCSFLNEAMFFLRTLENHYVFYTRRNHAQTSILMSSNTWRRSDIAGTAAAESVLYVFRPWSSTESRQPCGSYDGRTRPNSV
jgi:hypothetical protein